MDVEIRALTADDPARIAAAFAAIGWTDRTVEQYRRYLAEQADGSRAVHVAWTGGRFAGYVTVRFVSSYAPFRVAAIPEIVDLNVLPDFRRRGIASRLLDAAERVIAGRSATAGIGVGLYADYAAAHLMYLGRGYLPDGRGVAYRGESVAAGTPVRVDDDLALMMTRALPAAPD